MKNAKNNNSNYLALIKYLNLPVQQRFFLLLLSLVIYYWMIILLFPLLGNSAYMSVILPAIVAAGLYGRRVGVLTVLLIACFTAFYNKYTYNSYEPFFGSFLIGTVSTMFVAFVVGSLRDLYLKFNDEFKRRIEAEKISQHQLALLKESEERYKSIFENATVGIYRMSAGGELLFANPMFLKLIRFDVFGKTKSGNLDVANLHPGFDHENFLSKIENEGMIYGLEIERTRRDGSMFISRESTWAIKDESGNVMYIDGIIDDITDIKETEEEREKLIKQLQTALSEIRQLSGLLPICSSCKQIRDTEGAWQPIEEYLNDHSEAEFSHGICPACSERLYPDYT